MLGQVSIYFLYNNTGSVKAILPWESPEDIEYSTTRVDAGEAARQRMLERSEVVTSEPNTIDPSRPFDEQ